MAKSIDTLVEDVYEILENDEDHRVELEVLADFGHEVCQHTQRAISGETRERKEKVLYASELGKPCTRQIAYSMNGTKGEKLQGHTKIKFLYGNISEELLLLLVEAAGHEVDGQQERFEFDTGFNGWKITGRQDCRIDGVPVDVKTASPYAFQKVKREGLTAENDSFGYRHQLWFYQVMQNWQGEPKFLYMDKTLGHLELVTIDPAPLDFCNFEEVPVTTIQQELVARLVELDDFVELGQIPERMFDYDKLNEKSGNRELSVACSYCPFKKECHPDLRVFMYAGNKPVFITELNKKPRVAEVTDAFYKEE